MFVTGKDRSYKRSIYKLIKNIDAEQGVYRPVAYGGEPVIARKAARYTHTRNHDEFRPASEEEVRNAGYTAKVPLMDMLYKLGIGRPHGDYCDL